MTTWVVRGIVPVMRPISTSLITMNIYVSRMRENERLNNLPRPPDLVALVLDMSWTCPGLVPTVPVLGQNTVFMGTQDRLQNVSHGSVTCPLCPAT